MFTALLDGCSLCLPPVENSRNTPHLYNYCLKSYQQCRKSICVWPGGRLLQTPDLVFMWLSPPPPPPRGTTECSGAERRAAGRASTCCRGCRFTCGLTTARNRSSARRRTVARSSPLLETWRTTGAYTQVEKRTNTLEAINESEPLDSAHLAFPWCSQGCRFDNSAGLAPPFHCRNK